MKNHSLAKSPRLEILARSLPNIINRLERSFLAKMTFYDAIKNKVSFFLICLLMSTIMFAYILSIAPTAIPSDTSTPPATSTETSSVTISVDINKPVVLANDQVKVTVTGVSNIGDRAGILGVPHT